MDRIGFIGLGTMGVGDGRQHRPGRLPAHRLEPHRRPRPGARGPRGDVRDDSGRGRGRRATSSSSACPTRRTSRRSCSGPTAWPRAPSEGTLVIDCSTIAPSGSWTFAERLDGLGLVFVDAPVSGGSEGARNATLTIFVGGARAGRRAGAAGADRAWPDDHPRRADRRRPGGQGGQPGHPGGRLPRGRRGDRPGDEGGPRRPARSSRRSVAAPRNLGAREPQRSDGRQRLPARLQARRSTARTLASPSAWPTSSA